MITHGSSCRDYLLLRLPLLKVSGFLVSRNFPHCLPASVFPFRLACRIARSGFPFSDRAFPNLWDVSPPVVNLMLARFGAQNMRRMYTGKVIFQLRVLVKCDACPASVLVCTVYRNACPLNVVLVSWHDFANFQLAHNAIFSFRWRRT
jgi:hypothetical protein